jgi:hypothetical protein
MWSSPDEIEMALKLLNKTSRHGANKMIPQRGLIREISESRVTDRVEACRKRLRTVRASDGSQMYIEMDQRLEELTISTGEIMIEVKRGSGNSITVLCRQEHKAKKRPE